MYGIAAIHVVVNNGWLGMVRQWQELFHDERFSRDRAVQPDLPDYVKLAESFGIPGFRCEQTEQRSTPSITAALECGQTVRDRRPRRPRGEGLPDGARRPAPWRR